MLEHCVFCFVLVKRRNVDGNFTSFVNCSVQLMIIQAFNCLIHKAKWNGKLS